MDRQLQHPSTSRSGKNTNLRQDRTRYLPFSVMYAKYNRRSASVPRFQRPSYPRQPHHETEMNPWSEDIVLPPPASKSQFQQTIVPIDYIKHKLLEASKPKPQSLPPAYPVWMPIHYLMRNLPPTYEQCNIYRRNGQILPFIRDSICNFCNKTHNGMCSQTSPIFDAITVPFSQLPLFVLPQYSKSCNSYFLKKKSLGLQNNIKNELLDSNSCTRMSHNTPNGIDNCHDEVDINGDWRIRHHDYDDDDDDDGYDGQREHWV